MKPRPLLTQQKLKELLHYDPETGVFTRLKYLDGKAVAGDRAGSVCPKGYRSIYVDGRSYRCARLAWFYVHGHFPKEQIDHINMLRDDNRIANLRPATHQENQRNRGMMANNKSGYRGVSFYKRDNKWKAYVKVNGKLMHLGYFKDINDAISASSAARKSLFGEFSDAKGVSQ